MSLEGKSHSFHTPVLSVFHDYYSNHIFNLEKILFVSDFEKKREIRCSSLQAQNCTPLLCNPHIGKYDLVCEVVNQNLPLYTAE